MNKTIMILVSLILTFSVTTHAETCSIHLEVFDIGQNINGFPSGDEKVYNFAETFLKSHGDQDPSQEGEFNMYIATGGSSGYADAEISMIRNSTNEQVYDDEIGRNGFFILDRAPPLEYRLRSYWKGSIYLNFAI